MQHNNNNIMTQNLQNTITVATYIYYDKVDQCNAYSIYSPV